MDQVINLLQQLSVTPKGNNVDDSLPAVDSTILGAGISELSYRKLIRWLAAQIKQCGEMDGETVTSVDDQECFAWELSAFLKELGCPYGTLMERPISERFLGESDATLLVEYLAGEAATMAMLKHQKEKELARFRVSVRKPSAETDLQDICEALDINVGTLESPTFIFNAIFERLDNQSTTSPKLLFQPTSHLTPEQWSKLEETQTDLLEYYSLRQQMMLKRLDVMSAAFQWKSAHAAEVAREYRQQRRYLVDLIEALNTRDISDLLVTDERLLAQEKVGSTRRNHCRVRASGKNVFQGALELADRGGRVTVDEKPSMPGWSSREEGQESENLRRNAKKKVEHEDEDATKAQKKSNKKNRKADDVISGSAGNE